MLLFNNKTPKKINFNGKHVAKVIFNNVLVWLEKVLTTITGYPITLTNSTGEPLVDYKIYGNSVQNGTNLFDGIYKNGYITSNKVSGFSETVGNHYLAVIPCEPNTSYVLEKEYATERFVVGFTNEYPYTNCAVTDSVSNYTAKKITATSGENSQYLIAFVYNKTIDTLPLPNVEVYKPQSPDNPIEIQSVGDLVTDTADSNYGKYKISIKVNDNVTNVYLDEPLRKIGDYADYIDFESGKVVRNIENVDLGELSWDVPSGYSGYMYYNDGFPKEMNYKTSKPLGLCTAYNVNTSYGGWAVADAYEGLTINWNTGALDIKDTRFLNDANSFKEANKGNYFYYLLTTPTEETIELPTILTHKGTTIIEVDTTIQPSNMEVDYYAKGVA